MSEWLARMILPGLNARPGTSTDWAALPSGTYLVGRHVSGPFRVPAENVRVSGTALELRLGDDDVVHVLRRGLGTARATRHDGRTTDVTADGVPVRDPSYVVLYNGGREVLRIEVRRRRRAQAGVLRSTLAPVRRPPSATIDLGIRSLPESMEPGRPPSWETVTLLAVVLYRRKKLTEMEPALAARDVQSAAALWHGVSTRESGLSRLFGIAERELGIEDPNPGPRRQDVVRRVAVHALNSGWVAKRVIDQADTTLRRLEYAAAESDTGRSLEHGE